MRLVKDQQAARPVLIDPGAHRLGVSRIDEQVVRDKEAAVRRPRVDAEAALTPHTGDVVAVEQLESEPEALLELGLPLLKHRRRRGDNDRLGTLAQQQLARDQARLDRLAETGVISDEQVHAREPERLPQRLHLVSIDPDPSAKWRLEQVRVGCGDRAPPQRVEEGGEQTRVVEAACRQLVPALLADDLPVELELPEDIEALALRIIVRARQPDDRGRRFGHDFVNEPTPGSHPHQLTGLGQPFGQLE